MIALKIEAENIAALRGTLADLLASLTTTDTVAPALARALTGEVLPPEAARPPGKRGPKPRVPEPAAAEPEAPVTQADAPKLPSYDEVVNACKNLLGAKGMPALRELLKKFEVEQTKALKPEQYADVIAVAEAKTSA